MLSSNCMPRVHNLKTLSATHDDVDEDDLKAALAMTIAYAKENFAENCGHLFLDDFADEIGEAKECANDYDPSAMLLGLVGDRLVAEDVRAEQILSAELRACYGYIASMSIFAILKVFLLVHDMGNDGELFPGVDSKTRMALVSFLSCLA
ncbi:hypothetical protein BOTCAL_0181g00160 [Botryotinia calthae]|uniref:Uncharacterized protein n=1 Tax=Botryotinia calthae TaxID=38488 RepID=A0A4Y8D359_9HELO|nr:hypothetical protein BOTCAL_0181g00160 [Botryotinia calthae]